MSRGRGLGVAACAGVAVLAGGPAVARAALSTTVVPTVLPGADGTFNYTYLVTNSPTSTVGIEEFDLSAADTADLTNIVNPDGFFAFYTTGFPDVEFNSFDDSSDVAPGATATFSFTSPLAPQAGFYQSDGIDETSNAFVQSGGSTLSPVPEPATAGLAAVAAVVGLGRRRSRRT